MAILLAAAFWALTGIATVTETVAGLRSGDPVTTEVSTGATLASPGALRTMHLTSDTAPLAAIQPAQPPTSTSTSTLVYSTDFESGAGVEWDNQKVSDAAATTRFLGNFANETVSLSLSGLARHTAVQVVLDLLLIDSWDGASTTNGPDYWGFNVAGLPAPSLEDTLPGSRFAGNIEARGHLFGSASYQDSIYGGISYTFPHTTTTLQISFYGRNLQGIDDESWGIDNVRVNLIPPPSRGRNSERASPGGGR